MTHIIDGKAFANKLCDDLKSEISQLKIEHQFVPCIAVVLVGDDPASHVYVSNKVKRCEQLDIESREHRLDDTTTQEELLGLIDQLNKDSGVHGILVQLPLPKQIDSKAVINAIDPRKDVDGFHVENAGALAIGDNQIVPCTPLGSIMMLRDHLGNMSGMNAVVVGRSNIVGKPMAHLLLQENCTVTIAHSRTRNIEEVCRNADILVAAVGIPEFVKADWIKPGATVIDVGINRIQDGEKKSSRR
jgi:methylenetetrahydrofolate dehydrogenase (NADP+)/methenyltetrahydrofolate cyclohydrolase